jgi:molybdenum cofactor biosynthesis protein B
MTHLEHKSRVPAGVRFALVVVSDSRFRQLEDNERVDDESSAVARRLIQEKGYEITTRQIVPDESGRIIGTVLGLVNQDNCDVIVTIGGTGLSRRDVTIESVRKLLEKEVIGFGEFFRSLSLQRIGTASMLSRALAGIIVGKLVFCLPGSPQAIELGLSELVLPEIGHLLKHIRE